MASYYDNRQGPLASALAGSGASGGFAYDEEVPFGSYPVPDYSSAPYPYMHGVDKPKAHSVFLQGRRHRLNVVPMLISLIVPWLVFCGIFHMMSFGLHYHQTFLVHFIACLVLGGILLFILYAMHLKRKFVRGSREPTWYIFLAMTCLLAWIMGMIIGDFNFYSNAQPYYDIMNLNTYPNVDPSRMRGDMLLDAGRVIFTEGSALDVSKSMGFKNIDTYCVAPIINRNFVGTESSVDFWAVGQNCCSGTQADFHCDGFNNQRARSGMRLMVDADRPFYRLAVQQAEATYGLKAAHPLFFTWVADPLDYTNDLYNAAMRLFFVGMFGYLLFQLAMVAAASIAFSTIGYN